MRNFLKQGKRQGEVVIPTTVLVGIAVVMVLGLVALMYSLFNSNKDNTVMTSVLANTKSSYEDLADVMEGANVKLSTGATADMSITYNALNSKYRIDFSGIDAKANLDKIEVSEKFLKVAQIESTGSTASTDGFVEYKLK